MSVENHQKRQKNYNKKKKIISSFLFKPKTKNAKQYINRIKMIKKLIKNKELFGKTVLITGTTSGIGLACVRHLARLGCSVISCSRNTDLATKQLASLKEKYNFNFYVYGINLQDTTSIKELSGKLRKDFPGGIDFIIHNAGIFARPKQITSYGYEQHFFTNCIAPIFLTKQLEPVLKENSRVVFVSSISSKSAKIDFNNIDFNSKNNNIKIYANSKAWLSSYINHYNSLNQNLKTQYVLVHPGVCASSLMSSKNGRFPKVVSGIINVGMKILFHSSSKASLCEVAGLVLHTEPNKWIGPSLFGVWGKPKLQKLSFKNANPQIQEKCYKTLENIINNL